MDNPARKRIAALRRKDVTNLHFRSMMTAMAFGACLAAFAAAPTTAAAADTAVVSAAAIQTDTAAAAVVGAQGDTTALRSAVTAALSDVASTTASTSTVTSQGTVADTNKTAQAGIDYISLSNPAVTVDGIDYVPLRSTFAAMKSEALATTWKVDGEDKIMLTNGTDSYEVYLSADGTSIHLSPDDAGWPLRNENGTTYVPLSFFRSIIGSATVSLSGDNLLVLVDKNGGDVWSDSAAFWTGMATYQRPTQQTTTEKLKYTTVTPVKVDVPTTTTTTTETTSSSSAASTASPNQGPTSGTVDSEGTSLINDSLIWPTDATIISSYYGSRVDPVSGTSYDFHLGVDIAGAVGTPVYAAQSGTVTMTQAWDGSSTWGMMSYGNCIDISHSSGLTTRYAHLSQILVSEGQWVNQGDVIGLIGATGNVTGAHLHFETLINGKEVDPDYYIHYKS